MDAAFALGTALLTAYAALDTSDLPPHATHAADVLRRTTEDLSRELSAKITSKSTRAADRRRAHNDLSACWSALESALAHLLRMPADPALDEWKVLAGKIHPALFGDGLKFLLAPFQEEWAESDARLQIIEKQGYAEAIEAIGGGLLLGPLRRTHARYGALLGTMAVAPDKPQPDLRGKLTAFSDALRDYAHKIGSLPSPNIPGSKELSAALLHPLTSWESPRAHVAARANGGAPEVPAETTANEEPPAPAGHAATDHVATSDAPHAEPPAVGPSVEARAGP